MALEIQAEVKQVHIGIAVTERIWSIYSRIVKSSLKTVMGFREFFTSRFYF